MKMLTKKKLKLEAQLLNVTYYLKGSINSVCANCKRAMCICDKKTKLKVYRLTYKAEGQKTKIVYIPREKLNEAKQLVKNSKRVKDILNKLIELNIKIFQNSS